MNELFQKCPFCNSEETVIAYGLKNSPILIIGSEPEEDDCRTGKPFTTSGGILRAELAKYGIDYNRMRLCLLFNHKFPKETKDKCMEWSITKAIEESKNRKIVILVGATSAKYFTGYSTGTHNGLVTTSMYLSGSAVLIFTKPTTIFKAGLGELHFAIQQLKNLMERLRIE